MTSLPVLLASPDPAVRTRGITFLSSVLMTKPFDILDEFDLYFNFFMDALGNREEESITFYTLNSLLSMSIQQHAGRIKPKSISPILKYIAKCVDSVSSSGRVNAFVSDIFKTNDFVNCVVALLNCGVQEQHIIPLLQILAATESDSILGLLKPIMSKLPDYIIKNPEETIPHVMSCVMATSPEKQALSDFGATVIKTAAGKSDAVCRILFPYTAPIQTHPRYSKSRDLSVLYERISGMLKKETFTAEPNPAPFAGLASTMYAHKVFEKVDPESIKQIFTRAPTKPTSFHISSGLATCLDKISDSATTPPAAPSGGQAPVGHTEKKTVKINEEVARGGQKKSTFAEKKSSGLTAQWQRRWFEFYPNSKCLIWRPEHKIDGIKGVLFIDHHVECEKNGRILILKTREKNHQIQFEKQETTDDWYTVLSKCTGQ